MMHETGTQDAASFTSLAPVVGGGDRVRGNPSVSHRRCGGVDILVGDPSVSRRRRRYLDGFRGVAGGNVIIPPCIGGMKNKTKDAPGQNIQQNIASFDRSNPKTPNQANSSRLNKN